MLVHTLLWSCPEYAVKDIRNVEECLKDTFGTAGEICKLVPKSPQRHTDLKQMRIERGNEDFNVHSFWPTQWTMHCQTLIKLWEW